MSSMLAVIVIAVIAALVLAMLVAGGRKAARVRTRTNLGPTEDEVSAYRSHAEASRGARR